MSGPIFLAGCGRSGTTYLRSLIDAHPDIFIPNESLFITDYLYAENHFLKKILKILFWQEPQLRSWYTGDKFDFDNFSDAIEKAHKIQAQTENSNIWGQKTPRFIRHKEILDRYYPESKWILIYRDPRAVVSSMIESRSHFYSILPACNRWNLDNGYVLKHSEDKNTLVVKYEDLIINTEKIIIKIFVFLDIKPYSLDFLINNAIDREYKGSGFTNLSIKKGFTPIPEKFDNWKVLLNDSQIEIIDYYSQPLASKLGYKPIFSNPKNPKLYSLYSLKEFLILMEYLVKWPRYLVITLLRKLFTLRKI